MNFLMDARTGLGRFHDFRISNYDLMMELIDYCVDHSIKDVLELPDVKERVDLYFEQQELFKAQLERITQIHDKVAVIDLRNEETIYAGNRFMVYAMYPETEISVHVAWGFKKQNTAVMIGKSIINKSSKFDIGELCLSYGGGGHRNAGTCQLDNDKIDAELPIIIDKLNGKLPGFNLNTLLHPANNLLFCGMFYIPHRYCITKELPHPRQLHNYMFNLERSTQLPRSQPQHTS